MTGTDQVDASGTTIVALDAAHTDALVRFFASLPEGDRTFIKEDVTDPATVRGWAEDASTRWVARGADGEVDGYVAVRRLPGWSDHVAELRLVVGPRRRGAGLGRELARHAVTEAIASGARKLVVEVVAEQGAALALFTGLGFRGEALLEDHIRDRSGQLQDLMVLAHRVDATWSAMDTLGLSEALDGDGGPDPA
ncbi:GNAT family N-acetyltransferase [Blastococcus saxobsidens]|uniref:GNAT family N-acetyltransferase n=1 Tax=Blastococcus saxobsidens TaxID=138336 RepID=A0A6L9VZX0_9ACTN|nr:GNAT family N-acetyltransferase [Blastococcus saxobsidens]NEK85238.1 GNAT family N-acetyltransferase [Blastococcus saxobsidens]